MLNIFGSGGKDTDQTNNESSNNKILKQRNTELQKQNSELIEIFNKNVYDYKYKTNLCSSKVNSYGIKQIYSKPSTIYNFNLKFDDDKVKLFSTCIKNLLLKAFSYQQVSSSLFLLSDDKALNNVVEVVLNIVAETVKEAIFVKAEYDKEYDCLSFSINNKIIENVIKSLASSDKLFQIDFVKNFSEAFTKNFKIAFESFSKNKENVQNFIDLISKEIEENQKVYSLEIGNLKEKICKEILFNVQESIDVDTIINNKTDSLKVKCDEFTEKYLEYIKLVIEDEYIDKTLENSKVKLIDIVLEDSKKMYDIYKKDLSEYVNNRKDFFRGEIEIIKNQIKDQFLVESNKIKKDLNKKYQNNLDTIKKKIDKYMQYGDTLIQNMTELFIKYEKTNKNEFNTMKNELDTIKNNYNEDFDSQTTIFKNSVETMKKEMNLIKDEYLKSLKDEILILKNDFSLMINNEIDSAKKQFFKINEDNDNDDREIIFNYINGKIDYAFETLKKELDEKIEKTSLSQAQAQAQAQAQVPHKQALILDTTVVNKNKITDKVYKFLNMKRKFSSKQNKYNDDDIKEILKAEELNKLNTNHDYLDNNDIKILTKLLL